MITVHASRDPLRDDWVTAEVPGGQTIEQITGGAPVMAWIDGHEVPAELIERARIKDGVTIVVRPLPSDDNVLRAVGFIVVAVLSFYTGGVVGAAYGAGWGAAASAAASIAGGLLINQILPPATPNLDDGEAGSFNRRSALTGAANQVGAWQPIPRLYGRSRYYPPIPMTALPYTELEGSDQFLRMKLCLGYGPLEISGVEVGDGRAAITGELTEVESVKNTATEWNAGTLSNVSVSGDDLVLTDASAGTGTWTSPAIDVSAALSARSSFISWRWTAPDPDFWAGVNVTMEASVNGGPWQQCAAGEAIPGIQRGDDVSSTTVQLRATLVPDSFEAPIGGGGTTYVSPTLESITVRVNGVDYPASLFGTILIGETDLLNYDGVEFEIGRPDQMTLYPSPVIQTNPGWETSSDISGIDRDHPPRWITDGESAIRTTEADVTEIGVEVAGRLFSVNSKSHTRLAAVDWRVEYAPTGTTNWTVVRDPWYVRSTKRETVRRGMRWKVPKGQYDVRLTRLRTYHSDFEAAENTMLWSALRSIRSDAGSAFDVDGTITMDLRIKSSDQLSQRLDNLSVKATSVLPVWDGSQWVEQPTRTPAWIMADILTGEANRRPFARSQINTDQFAAWAAQTDADGDYFDLVYDDSATVIDRLQDVSAAGRGSWDINDDTSIGIVRDVPQGNARMVISPRNASGYSYQMAVPDIPHAYRVQFIDPNTWENTERIVYDDGYSVDGSEPGTVAATLYQQLQCPGCTDADQAWRYGRYHLAQQRLRPEVHQFTQDVQHLRYRRGQMLTLQHDVILVGVAAGRVKSVTTDVSGDVTALVSDEFLYMEPSTDYGLRIQRFDGGIATVGVVNASPGAYEVTLTSPVSDVEADCHFVFGELGQEAEDVKVTSVEPQGALQARITCAPAADNILDALTGTIPPWSPVITDPIDPDKLTLPVPEITGVESDESVLLPDGDGSLRVRMLVETSVASFPGWDATRQLRYRPSGDEGWTQTSPTTAESQSILDVDEGVEYEIQARGVRGERAGEWSDSTLHTVIGKTTPPRDVTGLSASTANWVSGGSPSYGIRLKWSTVPDPDLGRYEIRSVDSGWGDDDDNLLKRPSDETAELPIAGAGSHTFYVKAIDTGGRYSENAASVSISISAPAQPQLSTRFDGAAFVVGWQGGEATTFPIAYYAVRRGGTDWDSATPVDTVQARELSIPADWNGNEVWRVAAVDVAGNVGTAGSISATVSPPPQPAGLTSKVINLDVLLNWNAVAGTLPVDHYRAYRDDDENAGFGDATNELVTTVDGTFAALQEQVEGARVYWVTAVDTAGNEGPEAGITAYAESPQDLIVQSRFTPDFTQGTITDLVLEEREGPNTLRGPFDVSENWAGHFEGTGDAATPEFADMDALIAAGWSEYLQPARVASGSYQKEFDVGAVLGSTTITVAFSTTTVAGNPSVATTIEVRETTSDPWRSFPGTSVLANDVRYVRVTLDVTGSADADLIELRNLTVNAQVRKSTAEGTATIRAADSDAPLGGTVITMDTTFLDIRAVEVTGRGRIDGSDDGYDAVLVEADWEDVQGQNQIHVWAFDRATGNRVDQDISYTVRGIVN